MKSSYKIAILLAVAIFGFVIFHYATQDSSPTNPEVNPASTANIPNTTDATATTTPGSSARTTDSSSPPPPRDRAPRTTPTPAASDPASTTNADTTPPASTGGSLMDMINRRMATDTPPAPTPGTGPSSPIVAQDNRVPDLPSMTDRTAPTPTNDSTNARPVASVPSATDRSASADSPYIRETASLPRSDNQINPAADTTAGGPSVVTLDGRPIDEQQLLEAPERSALPTSPVGAPPRDQRNLLSEIERRVTGGTTPSVRDETSGRPTTTATVGNVTQPRTVAEQTYIVKAGDTLSGIAQTVYGRSSLWDKIVAANPDVDPNRLKVGQELTIPRQTVEPAGAADGAGPAVAAPATDAPGSYRIKPGDTFSTIAAERYGSENKWVDIAQANPLVDPTKLKVGQVIRLPDAAEVAAGGSRVEPDDEQPAAPGPSRRYTVKDTDTLSSIAQQFYGDSNRWRLIYNANRQTLGPDPDRIPSDVTIILPPAPGE